MKKILSALLIIPFLLTFSCTAETEETTSSLAPSSEVSLTEETDETVITDLPEPSEEISGAEKILSEMTLDEKIYALFIVTPEQLLENKKALTDEDYVTDPSPELLKAISDRPVTGVVLFGGNIKDPDQLKALTEVFCSSGMIVSIDEEGGDIVRIAADPDFDVPWFLPVNESQNPYNMYEQISGYLSDYGFNTDFAPVADIAFRGGGVIGSRSFGEDPASVSLAVEESVKAFNSCGIICVLKHFPGHGGASSDSHFGTAVLDKTLDQLMNEEFVPFSSGISSGAPMVMVGHITVPAVTGDLPSTLSPTMMSVLRDELGFEGVIITDSFWMEAITDKYGSGEASLMAIEAGADIVLMPDDLDEAYKAVKDAVENGRISEEMVDQKVLRILRMKETYGIL